MRSRIPDGWDDTTIGDVLTLQRGFDITKAEQRSGTIPVVSSGGVASYHDSAAVSGPGVVIGRKGALGTVFYLEGDFWPHDTTLWIKDFHGNDPRFAYYFFKSLDVMHLDVGSANPTLNRNHVHPLRISWPPLAEQRAIATVLTALDDKIDNDRRLATLLEKIAATVFRARFIDFVGADEFEDSEMGQIPSGWRLSGIHDVATVTYGAPFSSALFNEMEGVPLIRIRDLAEADPSIRTPELRRGARLIRRGDIVVGMDGEFRASVWHGPDAWLNQRVCCFDPHPGVSRAFLLESIKEPLKFFEATKGGTTVIHLSKRDIDTFRFVCPSEDVMASFIDETDPLLNMAVALRAEVDALAKIRDALLPKLISGEIRVPDTHDPDEVIGPVADRLAAATP